MTGTRLSKRMTRPAAGLTTLLTISLIAGASPASAEDDRAGRLRIVKDCATWSNVPGSAYCQIVRSNVPEIPPGANIYYDQPTDGPPAGVAGYVDSNIFVYVDENNWAVGRCTAPNDNTPGLCTIADGVGSLAGFSARIVVTYRPGGNGFLFNWVGPYTFKPVWR